MRGREVGGGVVFSPLRAPDFLQDGLSGPHLCPGRRTNITASTPECQKVILSGHMALFVRSRAFVLEFCNGFSSACRLTWDEVQRGEEWGGGGVGALGPGVTSG